ncbi:hypothetical protein ESCO_000048 [Escovopsis weberi]|uniref:Uncharacterized protein n=1 Tax=Escovopsis weberi TaxID=150374 RepID=A0A0M8MUG5_ESCWE|nr:hypothetical protein ESCO_000048 [Escovopsis weberi]
MTAPGHHAEGFHARIHPSEPLTTKGHKPGIMVGNDRIPEFHAETHPPGSAPPQATFQPNPSPENGPTFTYPDEDQSGDFEGAGAGGGGGALDMPGATSRDVYAGMGKPLQGMEGRELSSQLPGKKHTGERTHPHGRRRERAGLAGLAPSAGGGTGGKRGKDPVREHGWDLPEGVEKGMRGKGTDEYPGAEDRVGETAEAVATERPKGLSDEQG